jgi:hypothetical protein
MKCLLCDNESLKASGYCPDCEDIVQSKICGLLAVPAFILVCLLIQSLYVWGRGGLVLLFPDAFSTDVYDFLQAEFWALSCIVVLCVGTTVLFFRKKRLAPQSYIVLLLSLLVFNCADYFLSRTVPGFMHDRGLIVIFQSLVMTAVWVPYFVLSGHVKRAFIR